MILLLALACSEPTPAPPPLTVLAASSLTDVLPRVGAAWQAQGGGPLTFSFDASSRLARQLQAGAPADLFFSADVAWMDSVSELIDPASRRDLLGNTLVVVVPAESPWRPADLSALTDARLERLALAGATVPAGRYAREALGSAGVLEALVPRTTSAEDVRGVLAWVARGEADAGVVYATDARVEARVAVAFEIDPSRYTPVVYPAAALRTAPEAADAFLDFCQSPAGKAIFEADGFRVLP